MGWGSWTPRADPKVALTTIGKPTVTGSRGAMLGFGKMTSHHAERGMVTAVTEPMCDKKGSARSAWDWEFVPALKAGTSLPACLRISRLPVNSVSKINPL